MRYCIDSTGAILLAIFLCLGNESQIVIFKPVMEQSSYKFLRVASLFAEQVNFIQLVSLILNTII